MVDHARVTVMTFTSRHSSPTRHVPRQQQQTRGNEDILSSATGPSTARCSKDVTTHQHWSRARPGRPCPVPACIGQPLPCERRFSSVLGNNWRMDFLKFQIVQLQREVVVRGGELLVLERVWTQDGYQRERQDVQCVPLSTV